MMKAAGLFAIVFALLLLTSCILVDKQSMAYRYDSEKDELRIFQVYERFHATGKDGKLKDNEKREIAKIATGDVTFFFSSWFARYAPEEFRQQIADARSDANGDYGKETVELMELVANSVNVTNGQFFLNEKEELCVFQRIVVSDVSRLIASMNKFLNLAFKSGKVLGNFDLDQGELKHVMKLADSDYEWIELDGNRLVVRLPHSREAHFKMRASVSSVIRENGSIPIADILEQEILMSYQEPILELTIGRKEKELTDIAVSGTFGNHGEYSTLALDHVRQNFTLKKGVDVDEIRTEFLMGE